MLCKTSWQGFLAEELLLNARGQFGQCSLPIAILVFVPNNGARPFCSKGVPWDPTRTKEVAWCNVPAQAIHGCYCNYSSVALIATAAALAAA
eukprot:scaffold4973_cov19-Tisochrysis_lutea.AAC.1